MKTTIKTLTIALFLCLLTLSGCNLIVQSELVKNREFKGISIFDPNDYGLNIHYETNKCKNGCHKKYKLEIDDASIVRVHQAEAAPLNYAMFAEQAIVKCKINNRTYPVLFDTGNPSLTNISTAQIRENQFPIYPLEFTTLKGKTLDIGVTMIDELKVGNFSINNLPAEYHHYHTGYLLFGIPTRLFEIGQDKTINIPLTVMQKFKYIAFDNIKKQMEFSLHDSFTVEDSQGWNSYPIITTEDNRIYIKSTLESIPVSLMIDTGAATDLIITKDCFDKMIEIQPKLNKAWKWDASAFAPFAGGKQSAQAYFLRGLSFDSYEYKPSTTVAVLEKGIFYELFKEKKFDGIIGFPFFEDTIMVLDFENNLMWIKKGKGSRFEK